MFSTIRPASILHSAILCSLLCLSLASNPAPAQSSIDPLKSGFENPPASARPRVWWHWMNGNITREGIQLDLEWMHRVGIAGFQNFDAALDTPQVVNKRLAYMTPEWKDAFRYAISLGDRYGMEMAIAGSPGWSESGGPWVPPSHGMKKYVWSETVVEGGQPFSGKLAHPPTETGPFQDMTTQEQWPQGAANRPRLYVDAAVVAYRRPPAEAAFAALHARVTSSAPSLNAEMLNDGKLAEATKIVIPTTGTTWIQFEYPAPQTVRSITYSAREPDWWTAMTNNMWPPEKHLEASDDGQNFREVADLRSGNAPEHTISFPPATARYFRVTFKQTPPHPDAWKKAEPGPQEFEIAELALHGEARVNEFEMKGAFVPVEDLYGLATAEIQQTDAVRSSDVIDLTSKMRPDGTLDWTPPAGEWVVLRFGYSLQGITNHPATLEATGLEVDKLDRRYVKDYFERYLDSYKETVGADEMGKKGLRFVINDSWEAGSQNWTDNMLAQFKKLRGYDATPWLPVLAGRIVESAAASDRFLWDFRKTISDLIANEHYGQLEATLHERGMGHYGESHEGGRAFVADGMEVKKFNEVPMSAMWTQTPGVNRIQYGYNADDRESASVAHIYGQNLAAAESMTAAEAPWAWSPATLKPTADQELLNGIDRFVIHESAHQPLIGKAPGLTLGPYGQWFNRNETWAEEAGPWITYIARSSYLLQQGRFAADLVYFYGEDSNLTAIFDHKAPDIPAGYGFDYINADALIHELSVKDGRLVTKGGMEYRVLGLDPYSRHMSLPVLRAIHALVQNGAVVAGPKPVDDPSLADNQAEFQRLDVELFGDGSGVHNVGKGKVYAGQGLTEAFNALQLAPDFDYTQPANGNHLEFVHRKLANAEIYFVDNRGDQGSKVDATFRVTGKAPELWYAETGKSKPVSYKIADGRTTVPLDLEAWGTVFVVFRKPAQSNSYTAPAPARDELGTVNGPWNVSFPPDWGAPPSITMDELASWTASSDPGVKYFSGTATYIKTLEVPSTWLGKGAKIWIDLGDVKNLAQVTINGRSLGIVWHAPYRVDATSAIKAGTNTLAIRVTNAWVNRLIGDQQPGAKQYTFTTFKPYHADSPLMPSGLIGPVTIFSETER